MKWIIYGVIGAAALGYFFYQDNQKPKVDLSQVLNRTVFAMDQFDKHLKSKNIEKATDEHMGQLNGFLTRVMNKPKFHDTAIATKLDKEAKFLGMVDANENGKVDEGEKQIFTVEIDSANKRLIATDSSGEGTSRGFSGMGFLAGALIGAMLGRQRAAGIQPNSFNNRKLKSPNAYRQARSRARSGGLFGGK